MAGRSHTRSLQPPVAVTTGHGYPLANGVNSDSDAMEEDIDIYELRPRGREKIRKSTSRERLDDTVLLTRDIKEGDTLNAIALQYCCSVADIKRVNNLISEQDFFALRSVKIPVKKFSILTDTQFSLKGNPASRAASALYSADFHEITPAFNQLSTNESAGTFLQEVDRDIEQIVKCTDNKRENLDEIVSAFSPQLICFETDHQTAKRKDLYYGADWGIGWWTAVVIMLIVGIITPVFYLLYYEVLVKTDVSHHSTVESAYSLGTTPLSQAQIGNGLHLANGVPEKNHEHPQENVVHRHVS
ncbi:lysM and putative peptidoglycan-binding domain-containing protein 3 [Rhinatrema bivittatum]|uniref:lysM and putative peptidoglycan-binding domain-containing protein 3 n=1 Tax=Rhinatrema bivittatum TaxID=194408 RepID=UPI0011293B43|nr:lysM and putative peptidoglycan-binding domain-containing protein 3 [Rhinatrema bivittatum]